jgi:integrase
MPRAPELTVPGLDKESLLSDPEVARWRSNLARGSLATADVWLRRLRAFCARTGKLPKELLEMKPRELQDLFLDFVTNEEKRGSSGPYIAHTIAVARSWLKFNGVDVPTRVKIRNSDHVKEETPLTREQFRAVLNAASPKERVACILMAQAGLRPEVLGNYTGDDGLRLRDLPELKIGKLEVEFTKVPTMAVVPDELSKAGHRYPTFLGEEGCGVLKDYLEARLKAGELLGPESSVVKPERAKKPFIRTINIGDAVRHALRAAGFNDVRPYCLRTTFASALLEAENDGKVAHPFTVLWLGHKGDMSARYSANRGKLGTSMVDRMREAYRRCEPYFSTVTSSNAAAEGQEKVLRMTLKYLGVPDSALEGKQILQIPESELNALVEKYRGSSTGHMALPARQQVTSNIEVADFLNQGYEFVAQLGPDRTILRRPA